MKNLKKTSALLLALTMLFALCSCGDDKDTESGKDTSVVSDTKSGDIVYDDGFILPEDGKIEFGKNNKKNEETNEASETTGDDSGKSGKDNTDKDSGNTSSETTKPEDTAKPQDTTKPAESETIKPTDGDSSTGGSPADDGGWGGVNWN